MTPVFADASFYVALLSPRDQYHARAVQISNELRRATLVTELVLIEVSNALAAAQSRERAMSLWSHLQQDSSVAIIAATSELIERGRELYSVSDHSLSGRFATA